MSSAPVMRNDDLERQGDKQEGRNEDLEGRCGYLEGRNENLEERGDNIEGRDEDLKTRHGCGLDMRNNHSELLCEDVDERHQESDMGYGDVDERHQESDIRCEDVDERRQKSDIRCGDVDERHQESDRRCEDVEERGQESDIRCEDVDERHQESELRCEDTEERDAYSDARSCDGPILQSQISELQAQVEMMRAELTNLREKDEDKPSGLRRSESEDIVVKWYRTQREEGHEVNLPGLLKKKNSRSSAAPRVRPPSQKNVAPSLKNVVPSLKSLKNAVSALKTNAPVQKSVTTSQRSICSPRPGHATSPRHVRLNLWDIVQSSLNLAQTSRLGLDTNSTALPLKGKYHEPYNPSGTNGRFMSSLRARGSGGAPDSPRRSSVTRTCFHSTPSLVQSRADSVDSSQSSRLDVFSFTDEKLSMTEVMTTIYCDLSDQYGSMEVAAIYAATSLQIIDPREVHKYMKDSLNSDEVTLMSYRMNHTSLKSITEHPLGAENERQLLEIIEKSPDKLATLLPPIYLNVQEFEEAILDVFQLSISRRLARRVFHVLDKHTGRLGRIELKSLEKWHPNVVPPPENCPTPRRRASPSGTSLVGSVAESLDGRTTGLESPTVPPPAPGRIRGIARQWQHGSKTLGDAWDYTAPASGSRLNLHSEMDFRTSLRNSESPRGSGWNPVTKTEFRRGMSRNGQQTTRQGTSVTNSDCTSVRLSNAMNTTASGQTTPEKPGPPRAFRTRIHGGSLSPPAPQSGIPSRRRSMPTHFPINTGTARPASPDPRTPLNTQQLGTTTYGMTSTVAGSAHAVDAQKESAQTGALALQLPPNRVGTKESCVSEGSARQYAQTGAPALQFAPSRGGTKESCASERNARQYAQTGAPALQFAPGRVGTKESCASERSIGQYSRTSQGVKSSNSSGGAVSATQSAFTFSVGQENVDNAGKDHKELLLRPMHNSTSEVRVLQEPPSTTKIGWACSPTPPLPMDRSFSSPPSANLTQAKGKAEDTTQVAVAFRDPHVSSSYISSSPSAPPSAFQIDPAAMPDWMRPAPSPISFTIPLVPCGTMASPAAQSNSPDQTCQRNPSLASPLPPPQATMTQSSTVVQPTAPLLSAQGGGVEGSRNIGGQYTPFFSPTPAGASGITNGAKTPTLPLSGSKASFSARLDLATKPGAYRPLFSSQLSASDTRSNTVAPRLVQPVCITTSQPAGNKASGQAKFVSPAIRAAHLTPMPLRPPLWTFPLASTCNSHEQG